MRSFLAMKLRRSAFCSTSVDCAAGSLTADPAGGPDDEALALDAAEPASGTPGSDDDEGPRLRDRACSVALGGPSSEARAGLAPRPLRARPSSDERPV